MRLTTPLVVAAIVAAGCSPSASTPAAEACQDAVEERDAADARFQTAASAHDKVEQELSRLPEWVEPPEGSTEFPRMNPAREPGMAESSRLGAEMNAHLERITIVVEQNPDCFSAGERADAEKLARRLAEVGS